MLIYYVIIKVSVFLQAKSELIEEIRDSLIWPGAVGLYCIAAPPKMIYLSRRAAFFGRFVKLFL